MNSDLSVNLLLRTDLPSPPPDPVGIVVANDVRQSLFPTDELSRRHAGDPLEDAGKMVRILKA